MLPNSTSYWTNYEKIGMEKKTVDKVQRCGVNDNILSLGKLELILSFYDDNETLAFSDEGLTILHAPNGTGKTALLETYLALYGKAPVANDEGRRSRASLTTKTIRDGHDGTYFPHRPTRSSGEMESTG
jgi:hypothetical protein